MSVLAVLKAAQVLSWESSVRRLCIGGSLSHVLATVPDVYACCLAGC